MRFFGKVFEKGFRQVFGNGFWWIFGEVVEKVFWACFW